MKRIIQIFNSSETIFKGNALNLPIKEEYLIKKSIELFDDDDPCIIHQSFIVKEYISEFLSLFKASKTVIGKDHINKLEFLNFKNIDKLTFIIVG